MPVYDLKCPVCDYIEKDVLQSISAKQDPCPTECGGVMERVWLPGKANGVIDDSIPGGVEIKHGLCNPDGTPRRFDSHTDIEKAAKQAGLVNYVEHKTAPGTDKSRHTVRWTAPPVLTEEERVRQWRESWIREFGELPPEFKLESKGFKGGSRTTADIVAEATSHLR